MGLKRGEGDVGQTMNHTLYLISNEMRWAAAYGIQITILISQLFELKKFVFRDVCSFPKEFIGLSGATIFVLIPLALCIQITSIIWLTFWCNEWDIMRSGRFMIKFYPNIWIKWLFVVLASGQDKGRGTPLAMVSNGFNSRSGSR